MQAIYVELIGSDALTEMGSLFFRTLIAGRSLMHHFLHYPIKLIGVAITGFHRNAGLGDWWNYSYGRNKAPNFDAHLNSTVRKAVFVNLGRMYEGRIVTRIT